jgi:hypothetical protein
MFASIRICQLCNNLVTPSGFLDSLFIIILISPDDHRNGTFSRKHINDALTNSLGSARDDDHLISQLKIHQFNL